MAEEGEETPSPWYRKCFEYWRNRNRVGPGKVELPDCDFVIVAPRRTLRVLRPTLKSAKYYENTNDRPESIIDNFFTRWSRRPHSSGNCRCSFRHSGRLSTTEEQIISAEINRIRSSLCEAEKNGHAIEELEQRVSVNLQKLQVSVSENEQNKEEKNVTEKTDVVPVDDPVADEQKIKNKIVKDLERYINVLLEEILDDTVKYVAGAEDSLVKRTKNLKRKESLGSQLSLSAEQSEKIKGDKPSVVKLETAPCSEENEGSFNDISFSFHVESGNPSEEGSGAKNDALGDGSEGYVNQAFIGSTNDPDSLNFYVRRPACTEVTLEQLDCIDSGINSVETIEFQPDQEPSLEQSLLQIIDEKLGRTPLKTSWEDLSIDARQAGRPGQPTKATDEGPILRSGAHLSPDEPARSEVNGKNDAVKSQPDNSAARTDGGIDISMDNLRRGERRLADSRELEETVNEPSFENLRLEFKDSSKESSLKRKKGKAITKLREKLCANLDDSSKPSEKISWNEKMVSFEMKKEAMPIELDDYRKKWADVEEPTISPEYEQNADTVTFRRNRKPIIVFLHGFGSSAEIFDYQLQYFSSLGYPCIAPDMLGHGMSSAPDRKRDYHFKKLLRDLDAVLCHYAFKPGQKCVIVAHNYGCSFATALACKYDTNVHQLVLISGGGPTPLAPPTTESTGHCCLRAILAPFLMCGLHRDMLYSARGRQHPYCGPESEEQWPSHMKYVLDGMIWPEGDYVFHRRICTPTLLIHGLRDNKVSLVQECQMERTMMKAFLEAMPAAGHTPMTDCPEQLNHMIHCFIDLWKNKKW